MKQSTAFPILLLGSGIGAALYCAVQAITERSTDYGILFAIACVVAAIGWQELAATQQHNESFDSE